jgi:hypothetical protein
VARSVARGARRFGVNRAFDQPVIGGFAMLISRRALARKLAAFAGGLSLLACAATASAATGYSSIWFYYDAQGHLLGTAGLDCIGNVYEYDGDLPPGGYARHVVHRCDVSKVAPGNCYSVGDGGRLGSVDCSEMPGSDSY